MMPEHALPLQFLEAARASGRGMPPVERWNPAYCGKIDMRIAADGRWFYNGTPILRPALVKLFASILRKDEDEHVLVTPAERVGIIVEDAPFLAVEMAEMTGENGPTLAFRTNLDEIIVLGAAHPLRFASSTEGFKPYIRVRGDLWARLTRTLAVELAERLEEGPEGPVLLANGCRFAVPAAGERENHDG